MTDKNTIANHQPQQLEKKQTTFSATMRELAEDEMPLAKVLPAGGPLLGQEPCPSCGHFPGEPRDNPFRRCVACGGAA